MTVLFFRLIKITAGKIQTIGKQGPVTKNQIEYGDIENGKGSKAGYTKAAMDPRTLIRQILLDIGPLGAKEDAKHGQTTMIKRQIICQGMGENIPSIDGQTLDQLLPNTKSAGSLDCAYLIEK